MNCMLHLSTVDHAMYALLKKIFKTATIKEKFALAGGTSLALQIGHRKSIDFDIFSPHLFDVKELEIILTTSNDYAFNYAGNNTRMLFGDINGIKCDFVNEPAGLLEPFIVADGINYFSTKDIAAMISYHLKPWLSCLYWFVCLLMVVIGLANSRGILNRPLLEVLRVEG